MKPVRRTNPTLRHRAAFARRRTLSKPPVLTWKQIAARIEEIDPVRIGLDVFDTVLSRRVVGDAAVGRVVAEAVVDEGVWPGSVDEWLVARRAAAEVRPGGSLTAYLQHMARRIPFDTSAAKRIEESVELELTVAVPGARSALKQLRSFAPIVFVSDMHHETSFVQRLLTEHDLLDVGDEVVVSCDQGSTKSQGTLFGRVFTENEIFSGRAVFIGNDLWSDVTMAEEAGLHVVPALGANPHRYEQAVMVRPQGPTAAIASAARVSRLAYCESGLKGDDVRALGASVLGQMMTPFVIWAAAECRRQGITHVEFLARDGEVPLAVARTLPSDYWGGATLDYLHSGRRAWSLAAAPLVGIRSWVEVGTADDDAFLLHSGGRSPFSALLDRCGLTSDDLPSSSSLRSLDDRQPLSVSQLLTWRELLESGDLDGLIVERAQEPCDLILDFLRQRGLPDQRIAIVDVGWRGQQAWLVSALVAAATGHDPLHLHFGGDLVAEGIDQLVDIERFALDDSVRPHPIDGPVSCLEMFLSNGAARLRGYERDADGGVREIFDAPEAAQNNDTRRQLAEGACSVAARLPSRAALDRWFPSSPRDFEEQLAHGVRELLARFWTSPTRDEVLLLADLSFEVDDVGDVRSPVVRPYSLSELQGRSTTPRQWPHGSLVLTPRNVRSLFRGYLRLKQSAAGSRIREINGRLIPQLLALSRASTG